MGNLIGARCTVYDLNFFSLPDHEIILKLSYEYNAVNKGSSMFLFYRRLWCFAIFAPSSLGIPRNQVLLNLQAGVPGYERG